MIAWLRKQAMDAFGARATPEFSRLKAESIAEEAAGAVQEANFPGYAPELHEALRDRAIAEVRAAAPRPIDPSVSLADAWALERIARLQEELSRAQDFAEGARAGHAAAVVRLIAIRKPMGLPSRCLIALASICCVGLVVMAIGALLAPSADAYLLRSYLQSVFDADVERFAAVVALYLATACAAGLLGSQLLAVFITRGGLHWGLKGLFVLSDVAFAGAFALVRLGDHFSWQAVAVSVFEFALSLACTLFIFALAWLLKRDAERAESYRPVEHEVNERAKLHAQSSGVVREIETRLLAQMCALEVREDGVRRAELHDALAAATVSAAYAVEVSKLLGREAQNPSEEALTDGIAAHLAVEFAREGKR